MGLGVRQLFRGAFVLAAAGLISKVLSAGYRVPFQNMVGDKGFYIYQQVYPFLGIAAALSFYGIPAAVSRLVAKERDSQALSLRGFFLPVSLLLMAFSVVAFVVLYLAAGTIAGWMGDEELRQPLKMAAFIFLTIPFTSLLRGISQGRQDMRPTAVSQVAEQLVRVGIIVIGTYIMVQLGTDLYTIGSRAAFASVIGAVCGTILLFILIRKAGMLSRKSRSFSWRKYTKTIIVYGFFICLNYMLLLVLQFADAFTLVPGLLSGGERLEAARELKGVYDRAQPLVQLGIIAGSSLALAFVPSVTVEKTKHEREAVDEIMKSGWKLSVVIAAGATAGIIALFPYVNMLLYKNDSGTEALQLFMLSILFCSLALTASSLLEGEGKVKHTAVFILIGLLLKWLLNVVLVPFLGITGASAATVIAVFVVLCCNVSLLQRLKPALKLWRLPWKAIAAGLLIMIGYIELLHLLNVELFHVKARIMYLGFVLFAVLTGALLYGYTLLRMHVFTAAELESLPFGEKLQRIERRK